jgi:thioredoxin-related protein
MNSVFLRIIKTSVLSAFTLIGVCQQNSVYFEQKLTWQEVKDKAKKENKYLFVDCIATWCVPCKMMDKNVYTNDSVVNEIANNFIAVKIQFDTSSKDNEEIKSWYETARVIRNTYNIKAYPSFLFFSPDGIIVHEGIGYKNVQQFVALLNEAKNPEKQYFTLLKSYESGKKHYQNMAYLATTATSLYNPAAAKRIANDYINNYLIHSKDSELYTKENVGFILNFTFSSKDKGFKLFYRNAAKIDSLMNDFDLAQGLVHYIITKEEIDPAILSARKLGKSSPAWNRLKYSISKKYNPYYADRTILDAKIRWYKYKKNAPELTKNIVTYVRKYGTYLNNWYLNDYGWTVFQFSNRKLEINEAIHWMEKVINTEADSANLLPASIDTYANLLYKSGRKEEALAMEEKALKMAIDFNIPNFSKEYQLTVDKMIKGIPTWE